MNNNLYKLRTQKKMTQRQISNLLKVAQGSYQKYETGETEPNLDRLVKLADYFNVSVDYLIGREYTSSVGYLNEFDTDTVKNYLLLNEKNKMQASSFIAGLLFAQ